jgi:hypothetical protein
MSELAPDASIGEVRAEIDNARHDAARTLGALAERFTVGKQARQRVHGAVRALTWDGRRVRQDVRAVGDAAGSAIPPGVSESARQTVALLARVPIAIRVGVPALLVLRLLVWRRRRRHSG